MSTDGITRVKVAGSGGGFSRISEEDRFLAMLGYKDLYRSVNNEGEVMFREESCAVCGELHENEPVLDTYSSCRNCHSVVRQPSVLRNRYSKSLPEHPLEVLFATYGDPFDERACIDVTDYCREKVKAFATHDRINFKPNSSIAEVFGCDPAPGKNKQLRMRYRITTVVKDHINIQHGTLILDFNVQNKIPLNFLLLAPKMQYLRLTAASYGHPRGTTKFGRMSFDVLEILQSMVDQNGGSYLLLSSYTPLARMFGDPCPGFTKDLRLSFEIVGRAGEVKYSEIRGHLTKKLYILQSPIVAPLIFVIRATYGITPTAKKDRLEFLSKQLQAIREIEHREQSGLPVLPDDIKLLRKKGEFLRQRNMFRDAETNFVDISVKMQKLADSGGHEFLLDKSSFDPNSVFGNPCPGLPKILEVYLDCQGHDSEHNTESNEMTDTGIARNFITQKRNRFNIVVEDKDDGKGKMHESLEFRTDYSAPIILIKRATYGELNDITKCIDVTADIQFRVKGRLLVIDTDVDLNRIFNMDPSPGRRKELFIQYVTRGFSGNLRVREKADCLVAGIELGYPPIPPPDDAGHVMVM